MLIHTRTRPGRKSSVDFLKEYKRFTVHVYVNQSFAGLDQIEQISRNRKSFLFLSFFRSPLITNENLSLSNDYIIERDWNTAVYTNFYVGNSEDSYRLHFDLAFSSKLRIFLSFSYILPSLTTCLHVFVLCVLFVMTHILSSTVVCFCLF